MYVLKRNRYNTLLHKQNNTKITNTAVARTKQHNKKVSLLFYGQKQHKEGEDTGIIRPAGMKII